MYKLPPVIFSQKATTTVRTIAIVLFLRQSCLRTLRISPQAIVACLYILSSKKVGRMKILSARSSEGNNPHRLLFAMLDRTSARALRISFFVQINSRFTRPFSPRTLSTPDVSSRADIKEVLMGFAVFLCNIVELTSKKIATFFTSQHVKKAAFFEPV